MERMLSPKFILDNSFGPL